MRSTQWFLKEIYLTKKQGYVWKVESPKGILGYFKFVTPEQWYYSGPMVANELISAALAKQLGFPVADLQEARVTAADGVVRRGIVSLSVTAREVIPWGEAGDQVFKNPVRHVNQPDLLAALIVFDVWITNLDRSLGANLILYRNNPADRYSWYLIDHGNCLYGSPRKWELWPQNSPLWDRITPSRYTPKGLVGLQTSWPKLLPMIEKIEALTEADIDHALTSASDEILQSTERAFTRQLLLDRQKKLRQIFIDWLSP